MRSVTFAGVMLFICAVSLYANISYNLPCKNVTVKEGIAGTVFEGSAVYGEPGQPQLPVYTAAFLIPPDAELNSVTFSISGLAEEILSGEYAVAPAPPPVSQDGEWWPPERNIIDRKDVAVYSRDAFFPNDYIGNVKVGKLYCYNVVHVSVYLSKYNPVTKKLIQMKKGELVLNFSKDPAYSSSGNASYKIPVNIKKKVRNLVVNYNEVADAYNSDFTFTPRSKYVIMTTEDIQTSSGKLGALIESKEQKGYDVEVVLRSVWGGTSSNMRLWLQNNYQSMGIEYVLIIGDPHPTSGDVPMKVVSYSQGSSPTDFYFSQLSGSYESDGDAEVDVGRIPVFDNNINQLDAILDKCIAYENKDVQDIQWRTNALLIACPLDDQTPGSGLFEDIKSEFVNPGGWNNYRIYDDNYGSPDETNCSYATVGTAWNNNRFGLIQWMTHGTSTLATSVMNTSNSAQLTDEYNPIVFMGSCTNADPETSNNLSFAVMKSSAIASVAATGNSYYYIGQTEFENKTTIQGFVYEFARGMIVDSLGAGSALNQVKSRGNPNELWVNYCVFILFGCPDIGVYTHGEPTPINNGIITPKKTFDIKLYNNTIHFQIPGFPNSKKYNVQIDLFNAQGKLIENLLNEKIGAGRYSIRINTINKKLPTGLYLCRIKTGTLIRTIKLNVKS